VLEGKFREKVESPEKVGIFDQQLKVDSNGKAGTWNALCSAVRKPAPTHTPGVLPKEFGIA